MISIIVPTVNRHTSLVKLVASLRAQKFPADEYEILLVYNFLAKNKRLPDFPWPVPQLRRLVAPARGVNNARNAGLLAARGDLLLFIDDDCVLQDENFLAKIKQKHLEHPEAPAIGGPYKISQRATFWSKAYHHNMDLWLADQRIDSQRSRALLGGNASYKAWIFNSGLRFTPGIKYGGSETPLNLFLFEKYGPLYFLDELPMEHKAQMSLRNFIYKAYMQGKGFAWQTKLRPQQIQKSIVADPTNTSWLMRLALNLYSFVFMVGFRTSILERTSPLRSLSEEFLIYLRKPFVKLWQSVRHSFRFAKVYHEP